MFSAGANPAHTGTGQAAAKLLTAAFGQPAADGKVVFAPLQILPAALVVTEVAGLPREFLGDLAFVLGVLSNAVGYPVSLAFE